LILSYIIPFKKLDAEIESLLKIKWDNPKNQKKWFFTRATLIKHLSEDIDPFIFQGLNNLDLKQQTDFHNIYCAFIGNILKLFPHYFYFKPDILDLTNF